MRATAVEQLFLRRRSGRVEVLALLETPAGERQRHTLMAPTASLAEAVRYAAVHLGRRGLRPGRRLRVRVERGGSLHDDPALIEEFRRAIGGAQAEERWD